MKLSQEERAAIRDSLRQMSLAGRLEYFYTYYKLPILLALIALVLLGSGMYRHFTKKDIMLYSAYVNISIGDDLNMQLNSGFVSAAGADPRKSEVYTYQTLYLSDDSTVENHEYAYASQMKIMAAVASKQLDVVLMNKEAYDILSHNGYLLDLPESLSQNHSLYQTLKPYLTSNTVIIEDNSVEYHLNEADTYQAVTEESINGINVSKFPLFQNAGFSDTVYLGVIRDSPHLSTALQYMEYIIKTD